MMDNTWATPLYFRPLDHGVDISIHAATKYPAGHSDVLLGTVSANAACWPQLCETLPSRWAAAPAPTTSTRCCAACAPWACGSSAIRRARWRSRAGWKASPAWRACCIRRCDSHPGHALWKRDFCGVDRHLLHRARRRRPEAAARLPRRARRSSASAIPGAAMRAWPCRSSSATAPSPRAPTTAR